MESELTLYSPFIKEIKALIYRRQYEAMRGFYVEYSSNPILPPMVAEIGWKKNVVIVEIIKQANRRSDIFVL
jgi:hypothetical protein